MSKSKVFFTDLHVEDESLPQKLKRLMKKSGFEEIDFKNKYVAIKLHFGEWGNLAYLRPQYARIVGEYVKELGGKAFVTDCNTLYVGERKNALDHLDTAYKNGYNPFQTGMQTIIADGIKGNDEVYVKIEGGDYIKEAKIGRAIMDADIIISLAHFKGHMSTGFGGALKNIGMGGGSRAGKMEMHSQGKPHVETELCIGCGSCIKMCAHDAPKIKITDGKCTIDHDKCVGCGMCLPACPVDAIKSADDEVNDILNCKIAEYTKAIIQNKPNFHINMIMDVSPYCDCSSRNDIPIVPDVGMLCSFDPVAIDRASADLVNKQPVISGSRLDKSECKEGDHFHRNHPETNWESQLIHGEKIGIGFNDYELIVMK